MPHKEGGAKSVALLKAVAYARFSSDLQREESIEAQVRAIKAFAEQNGYTLLKVYIDRGISGTTDNRPQFQNMIDDAKSGQFDAIIVHKLDRFARNRADSAIYRKELEKHGVKLISVLENFDDSPEAVILQSVIEGYNEYYSKNLRREVMKGLKENALSCRHTGGTPCLGYDVDKSTMRLVINEYEAGAVRLIYKMYLANEGYTAIINELNSKGYRTKRGVPFGKNSLYEILRNEKYSGVYTYNKSTSKNADGHYNRHRTKEDADIIRIDGGVPAIISKKDFEKVQIKMAERKHKNASYRAKQEYLLSGKIVCGECGCSYAGNSRKPNATHPLYVSYRCTKKNGKVKCKNPEISRDKLEKLVLSMLADKVFDEGILPDILNKYNKYVQDRHSDVKNLICSLKSKIEAADKGINNIVNVVMETGSSALNSKLQELEAEKRELELALTEANNKLASVSIDAKSLKIAFNRAKQMLKGGNLSNRKALIERYVNRVTIYKDKIVIEFNIFDEFIVRETVSR